MAARGVTTTALGLEDALWESANRLRSSMDAAEYKHVVLGLLFLKYVSDKFEFRQQQLAELVTDESSDYYMPTDDARRAVLEDRDEYTSEGVFWVPAGHRWTDLRKAAKQTDIGQRIDAAMEAIEKDNPTLKGVLPKTYARRELTAATLGGLIDTFSRDDLAAAEHEGMDVLGRVYEYFLAQFASNEGKNGGEFYTPRSVVSLLTEMLRPYNGRVFDPCCGSGGMFVQAEHFVESHGGSRNDISVFGQERNPTTWRLAKMNLAIRGIEANLGPEWADSFHDDQHPDLRADFILANPPFNISDWAGERLADDPRWTYGTPPPGNANYAWLQTMLAHLSPTGTMGVVLANGSLTVNSSGQGEIRKRMVDADVVECVVALPSQLFYSVQCRSLCPFGSAQRTRARVRSRASGLSATARARCSSLTPATSAIWRTALTATSRPRTSLGSLTPTTPGVETLISQDMRIRSGSAPRSLPTTSETRGTRLAPDGTSEQNQPKTTASRSRRRSIGSRTRFVMASRDARSFGPRLSRHSTHSRSKSEQVGYEASGRRDDQDRKWGNTPRRQGCVPGAGHCARPVTERV